MAVIAGAAGHRSNEIGTRRNWSAVVERSDRVDRQGTSSVLREFSSAALDESPLPSKNKVNFGANPVLLPDVAQWN